jgi:hypothetical protein
MWVIAILGLLAVSADLVANDKPYYLKLDGQSYYPIAIDYGVWLGLRQWPEPLLNQRFSRLAQRGAAHCRPPVKCGCDDYSW